MRLPTFGIGSAISARFAPLRARFEALQPREQIFVGVAATVIALALIYTAVWQPVAKARARHEADLETAHTVANTLSIAEAQIRAQGPRGGSVVGSGVSLLSALDQAAKSGTLTKAPSKLQPDGENQARVVVEDIQFDVLVRWMYELQDKYGLKIDIADIEHQSTPGQVTARLGVSRAP